MPIDRDRAKHYLKGFDFRPLFVEELGWDKYTATLPISVGGTVVALKGVVEKRGVVVLVCEEIPDYTSRLKIEKQVAKSHFEHFIIFTDKAQGRQVWQWARREPGRPLRVREHRYEVGQSGELLIQKLENVLVTLESEDSFTLSAVTQRLRAAFDVETVTKKFYERFKTEHERFLAFIEGIPDQHMEGWYASVMMNRLMFLYFIQAKTFLNGDVDYLRAKLSESKERGTNLYYRDVLRTLFFEGFAKRKHERTPAVNKLLGDVPYLNGGLFQRHQIEDLYGKKIQIPDAAFERLFEFFKEYQWHLDDRPERDDSEINPDVLGYIFEKYINQKQMGAYYTKEDITEYISKGTILPFLFDTARKHCAVAFEADGYAWRLTRENPDRYIYHALSIGNDLTLPAHILPGIKNVAKRGQWNSFTPFAEEPQSYLPRETWREFIDRRRRYDEVRKALASGEIVSINDFLTLNIDIRQFAEDVIQYSEGPELVRAFYKAITGVSILDPTCGSGAFLFAALNVLKPLYEACLKRMDAFVEEADSMITKGSPEKFKDFRHILAECRKHPNQDYFVLKSIIVNNLYGVDIMEEAIEICKLRLFLKLVAQVDSQDRIEPLPDIDFNIQAGNALVGYAHYGDVELAVTSKFDFSGAMQKIEDKAKILDSAVQMFRRQQTELEGIVTNEDKLALRKRFADLNAELNEYLVGQFSKTVNSSAVAAWRKKYAPLHWFSEFHSIMSAGGFDVVIGNPPYVEEAAASNSPLSGFVTAPCGDLYAYVCERAYSLLQESGRIGLIVPISIFGTDGFRTLQDLTRENLKCCWITSYSNRPSQLFVGAQKRLTILIGKKGAGPTQFFTGAYLRWIKDERECLFPVRITYCIREQVCRVFPASLEKIATNVELNIFAKLLSCGNRLESSVVKQSAYSVFYTRKFGYFLAFLDFVPDVVEIKTNKKVPPSELKSLCFQSKHEVAAAVAALSSTTFFWFWNTLSDCRNLNRRDLLAFPLEFKKTPKAEFDELVQLGTEYLRCLNKNSHYMTKSGLRLQTFDYAACKPLVDQIDQTLGRLYKFTPEEIDFIINYDIKYRMRPEAGDDE